MDNNGAQKRRVAEKRGRRAELIAELFLLTKGFRTVARRFKTKAGEVDLIARRGDLAGHDEGARCLRRASVRWVHGIYGGCCHHIGF